MTLSFFFLSLFLGRFIAKRLELPIFGVGIGYAFSFFLLLLSSLCVRELKPAACISLGSMFTIAIYQLSSIRFQPSELSKSLVLSLIRRFLASHWPFLVYLAIYIPFLIRQGAYIETPSDPVGVHLYRLGEWLREGPPPIESIRQILVGSASYLGYLFPSALISLSPLSRSQNAELLAVLNTFSLVLAIYSVAFYFFKNSILAVIALTVGQLTVGVSIYSYFRYYTFGPTFLNMILVFESMPILWELRSKTKFDLDPKWIVLGVFWVLSWLTHKQETLYLFIFLLTAFTLHSTSAPEANSRAFFRMALKRTVKVFLLAVLSLALVGKIQQMTLWDEREFFTFFKIKDFRLLMGNLFASRISSVFNIALALCLASGIGGMVLRSRRLGNRIWTEDPLCFLFWTTWAPFAVMLFPPLATVFAMFFYDTVFYRILYLCFYFMSFPILLVELAHLTEKRFLRTIIPLAGAAAVFGISFLGPNSRTLHFLKRSRPEESYKQNLEDYLALRKLGIDSSAKIFTDPITAYPMNYLLGNRTNTCDVFRCYFPSQYLDEHDVTLFQTRLKTCDYLVVNDQKTFSMSRWAAHWPADIRNIQLYHQPDFQSTLEQFQKQGLIVSLGNAGSFRVYKIQANEKGKLQ